MKNLGISEQDEMDIQITAIANHLWSVAMKIYRSNGPAGEWKLEIANFAKQLLDAERARVGVPQEHANTKESYERGLKDALAVVKGGKNIVAISNLLKRPAPPAGAAQPGDDNRDKKERQEP